MAPSPADRAHADAFTASRTRMEEMLAHLSDPVMTACTQEVLEEYVTSAGRELLRQMMQDQLDVRAAAELDPAGVDHGGCPQVLGGRQRVGLEPDHHQMDKALVEGVTDEPYVGIPQVATASASASAKFPSVDVGRGRPPGS